MKLRLKQDEIIKEGLKIEQSVKSIKLRIGEITKKLLERPMQNISVRGVG